MCLVLHVRRRGGTAIRNNSRWFFCAPLRALAGTAGVACLLIFGGSSHGTAETRPWEIANGRAPVPLKPAADDGLRLLTRDVFLTETSISPDPQLPLSFGNRDQTDIHFTVIDPDTIFVQIEIEREDPPLFKAIETFRPRPGVREYVVPFSGVLFGENVNDTLSDGDYVVRVFANDLLDTGRVEVDTLHLEIDRQPPILETLTTAGDRTTYKNGDTVVIDAVLDRPGYDIVTDFSRLDSDTAFGTTVFDHGDGRYTIRHNISPANTTPDQDSVSVPMRIIDAAGNPLPFNGLFLCLSNGPPRLVSLRVLNPSGPVYRNGGRIEIETIWNSQDTLLSIEADFRGIDSGFDSSRVSVSRFPGNRYELGYTITTSNAIGDSVDFILVVQAHDRGCGVSELATFLADLDNAAGTRPSLNPVPAAVRVPSVDVSGFAPGSFRVELLRNGTAVDTADVDDTDRFNRTLLLENGNNVVSVVGLDAAGNRTAASLPDTVRYLTGAFLNLPTRFSPGDAIEIGLSRTGASLRAEFWNLSGDLVAVIEDPSPRDLYVLNWNGRNDSGQTVNTGPVVSLIEITYADGGRETLKQAFVLVNP